MSVRINLQFVFIKLFLILISVSVKAQLDNKLISALPDSCRPVPVNKKILTTQEKIRIIQWSHSSQQNLKSFFSEIDSVAASLAQDTASADIDLRIKIDYLLNNYYD